MSGREWDRLARAVEGIHPEAVVVPYVMLGASDARHFAGLSPAVYRFTPFELSTEERGALHARDERIRVSTWLRGIEVYREVLRTG